MTDLNRMLDAYTARLTEIGDCPKVVFGKTWMVPNQESHIARQVWFAAVKQAEDGLEAAIVAAAAAGDDGCKGYLKARDRNFTA